MFTFLFFSFIIFFLQRRQWAKNKDACSLLGGWLFCLFASFLPSYIYGLIAGVIVACLFIVLLWAVDLDSFILPYSSFAFQVPASHLFYFYPSLGSIIILLTQLFLSLACCFFFCIYTLIRWRSSLLIPMYIEGYRRKRQQVVAYIGISIYVV